MCLGIHYCNIATLFLAPAPASCCCCCNPAAEDTMRQRPLSCLIKFYHTGSAVPPCPRPCDTIPFYRCRCHRLTSASATRSSSWPISSSGTSPPSPSSPPPPPPSPPLPIAFASSAALVAAARFGSVSRRSSKILRLRLRLTLD